MKFRIVEMSNGNEIVFKPQIKQFLWWRNFTAWPLFTDTTGPYGMITTHIDCTDVAALDTKTHAEEFIESYKKQQVFLEERKKSKPKPIKPKIHEVSE
jgi:hypothetical protein